ncbi:MAG: hypothetical protein KKA70_10775 [Proteobacteria bacterium]|nr:hypothetical protein [Pseudomonadota bacterium]MBU1714422.1 hypothetical protein [Pseudomonadota bacterium]
MVLARDVMTSEGRVLCGKGTPLSDILLERLKKMEIAHVAVEGRPVKVEGEKTLQEELLDIEKRFSKVMNATPLMYLRKKVMEKMVASRRE